MNRMINQNAPVITRDQAVISAPLERVWNIQIDVAAWPQWQPDVDSVTVDGPLAVGRSFRWQTAGLDIVSTVKVMEPFGRIEWGGPANGITAIHVWSFDETSSGVLVETEESWEGAPVDAATEQMQAALDDSLAQWLRNLKAKAESAG